MIRVLIAEDMHLTRYELVALLQLEPYIEVIAELDRVSPARSGRAPTSEFHAVTAAHGSVAALSNDT